MLGKKEARKGNKPKREKRKEGREGGRLASGGDL